MKDKTKPGFSDFGKSFQEKFTILLLKDKKFAEQMSEVLDIAFLELVEHRWIAKNIFDYKEKYKDHPSIEAVKTIVQTELGEESSVLQEQVRDFFSRCFTDNKTPQQIEDQEFVKEKSLDFCKKQKLYEAMSQSVDLLEKCSFDEISSIISEAMKLGVNNDLGYDYIEDFEERYKIRHRNPISTGWVLVDQITRGGLGTGELGVVIAPSGTGKSLVLSHLGAQAIKAGCGVVHYTLELADTYVGNRYDSCITGVGLNDIHTCKERIFEEIKNIKGRLLIKEYPTKSASTNTIKAHLDKLKKEGFPIDMVIVDYADLLRPTKAYKEKRIELESIYEELRGIAQEYEVPLYTASQTNRAALNAEIITMESISEAFNKCFVADFIFTLSRTIEDKNTNQGRIYIAKNRNGPDGIVFPVFMEPKNVKIKVLQPSGETVQEIEKQSSETKLKKIYKSFKSEKE
jgi:replicative DNA helicase